MRSPFTGQEAFAETLGTVGIEAPWFLVREVDGAAYFASAELLARCEAHPLLPTTALAAFSRVILHNRDGAIPALLTESEEMFMPYQTHSWAAEGQVYCPVFDPDLC